MRQFVLSLWLAASVFGQSSPVVGTVDGKDVTKAELDALTSNMPPETRSQLAKDPAELLRYYGFVTRLATMAEENKLDEKEPYKDQLRMARIGLLAQAQLNESQQKQVIGPDEQRKYYEDNKGKYQFAKVHVIYIPSYPPGSSAASPLDAEQSRLKAEGLLKQLRDGADFAKLAKENSAHAASAQKGGDLGTIKGSDNYPPEIKKAIFGAKNGDLLGPIQLANGYYILRVDENRQAPYEEVKDAIYREMFQNGGRAMMDRIRSEVKVTVGAPGQGAK